MTSTAQPSEDEIDCLRCAARWQTARRSSSPRRDQTAISSIVRPQPMQTLCASSVQTLTQGDSTRGSGAGGGVMAMGPALNYGDRSPILQTLFGSLFRPTPPKNTK